MLQLGLDAPRLRGALQALSPVFLRLSGTLADFVRYDTGGDGADCRPFSAPTLSNRGGYELGSGCLPMDRWDRLHTFAKDAGARVLFGIGALVGRQNATCPPDVDCRVDLRLAAGGGGGGGGGDPNMSRKLKRCFGGGGGA